MRQTPNAKQEPVNIVGGSTFGRYRKISSEKTYNMFITDEWLVNTAGYQKAYELFKKASAIPLPATQPFVEEAIYTWASLYNLSICTEKLGKKEETAQILERLSQSPYLPTSFRNMIEKKRKKF